MTGAPRADRAPLRLVLMRHAKSSWKTDAPTDHARPLNKRGRRAAPKVGAELARRGWAPDAVLSSDSARTVETWERMRGSLGAASEARFFRQLYHASTEEVRVAAAALGEDVRTALMLGHNPGWEEAVEWLTGEEAVMKTGSAALMSTEHATWTDAMAAPGGWRLHEVLSPRDLG